MITKKIKKLQIPRKGCSFNLIEEDYLFSSSLFLQKKDESSAESSLFLEERILS